jgi:YD repeat-containing protein
MRPITISLLILMFFLFSCGSKNSNPDNYFNRYELIGDVKEVIQETYFTNDKFGNIVKTGLVTRQDYSFDINHNILSVTQYSINSISLDISSKWTWKYDDENNCIESRTYDEYGDITTTYIYKYQDEYVEVEYFSNGEKNKWTEKIDKNKNIIENKDKTRFIYDSRNNLIEVIYSNNKNIVYEYNSDGKLTSHGIINIKYNNKGFIENNGFMSYEYEYDTQGNWVKKIEFSDGHPILIRERKLKYY